MRKLFFLDLTRSIPVFSFVAVMLFSGCSGTSENTNASSNASANNTHSAPASESGALSATPTPELTADGLPKIAKNEFYKTTRENLLKAGWKPARSKDGDDNCVAGGSYCKEFPELESGPSSGAANAIFRWERNGKIAKIFTIGEDFAFVNAEVADKASADAMKPLSGSYTYKYTEDYGGRIVFTFDGKGGAKYTWDQEDVSWTGKGTAKWSDSDQGYIVSIVVHPEDDQEGDGRSETYVFKSSGKDLTLAETPEGMSPYNGKKFVASK